MSVIKLHLMAKFHSGSSVCRPVFNSYTLKIAFSCSMTSTCNTAPQSVH